MQQLDANKVKPDITTQSLLFTSNVLLDQIDEANINLFKVNQLGAFAHCSEIKTSTLSNFFDQSLKRDNFGGLA